MPQEKQLLDCQDPEIRLWGWFHLILEEALEAIVRDSMTTILSTRNQGWHYATCTSRARCHHFKDDKEEMARVQHNHLFCVS